MTAPLVIIGSGLAGYSVAREWRKLDTTTPLVIITQDSGDFYSKPLLSTAVTQEKTADALAMSTATDMAKTLHAEIITHTAVEKIDLKNKAVHVAEKAIAYSHLVLATGSTPFHLKALEKAKAFSVNSLDHYRAFRAHLKPEHHVAIVGAGLVGTELAHDLSAKGYRVSAVAMENTPLRHFIPEALGKKLQEKLESLGVQYFLNTAVTQVEQHDNQQTLILENGKTIQCDVILSAVGIHAETHLAKAAGLAVSNGIHVNACLQTSDPFVYAVGDCVSQNNEIRHYIAPILHQSRALAKTLTGESTQVAYPVMPVVVKTPSLPISFVLPKVFDREETDNDKILYFYEDKLVGFVVVGEANKERQALVAKLSA